MREPRTEHFGAAVAALFEELDWNALGLLYCRAGGEEFFPPPQRDAILDAGLRIAGDLGDALGRLPGRPDGADRSLYFGAALAELPLVLFETLVAGRELVWVNLAGDETTELNRALAAVAGRLDTTLPRVRVERGVPAGPFDHLWCASVLTDPDHFPALHDELYERRGTDLAVGGGDRAREHRRAERIARELVAELRPPALLSTSEEELAFFEAAAGDLDLDLGCARTGRTSPIVGDVVRSCRVSGRRTR